MLWHMTSTPRVLGLESELYQFEGEFFRFLSILSVKAIFSPNNDFIINSSVKECKCSFDDLPNNAVKRV